MHVQQPWLPSGETCQWPDCASVEIVARGLCQRDYMRAKREGRLSEFAAPSHACAWCGDGFRTSSRGFNRFCSRDCQRANVDAERIATRVAELVDRACAWCGTDMPTSQRATALHCSVKCQQAHHHALNPEMGRARSHRRRASMRATAVEPVDYDLVWRRDGGRCWICGESVDTSLAHPAPMSRSWDHVIPLAAGGAHATRNLAVAHLFCNMSKHARLPDTFPAWWPGEEESDACGSALATQSA